MEYGRLKGLTPEEYQYPDENTYMKIMKSIPLFDKVVSETLHWSIDIGSKPEAMGNYCRITKKTNPHIYRLYLTALERLDMPKEYPLYSKLDYEYNAAAYGEDYIIIHTSFLNGIPDAEVLSVIGHEIGHIKSGHALYKNMAANIVGIIAKYGGVIGQSAAASLVFALMHWDRCAEYTADRAGVIASCDHEAGISLQARLMGLTDDLPHINVDKTKLLAQTDNFMDETSDPIGKILCAYFTSHQSHPWCPLRIRAINDWYNSGEYSKLVNKYI